jgi:hypothetical protein
MEKKCLKGVEELDKRYTQKRKIDKQKLNWYQKALKRKVKKLENRIENVKHIEYTAHQLLHQENPWAYKEREISKFERIFRQDAEDWAKGRVILDNSYKKEDVDKERFFMELFGPLLRRSQQIYNCKVRTKRIMDEIKEQHKMKRPRLEKLKMNIIGNIFERINRDENKIEVMENTLKVNKDQYITLGSKEDILKKKQNINNHKKGYGRIFTENYIEQFN